MQNLSPRCVWMTMWNNSFPVFCQSFEDLPLHNSEQFCIWRFYLLSMCICGVLGGYPPCLLKKALSWSQSPHSPLLARFSDQSIWGSGIRCQTECQQLVVFLNFFNTDTFIMLTPLSLGLKEVVYLSDKYHNTPGMIASRRLLDMAGIQYRYRN